MSITAVGPAARLDGPLPQVRPQGLLALPGVLQPLEDLHLFGGAVLWGYPEATPGLWDPCLTGTFRTKSATTTMRTPRFDAFVAHVPITCSTLSLGDPEEFAMRAEAVLDATLSYAIEKALAQGVPNGGNAFFGDTHLTQLGGGAVLPETGIAFLENAIGQTGRGGILHLTPGVVGKVGFNLIREYDPDGVENSGDEYLCTANGTPVSAGAGYIGSAPAGKTPSDPSTGVDWCFATGPVHVYLGEMALLPEETSAAIDRAQNVVTYRAERAALAVWDGALQSGALVDWTP